MPVTARRLLAEPVIRPHMDARMGDNINGPSIIEAPSWAGPVPGRDGGEGRRGRATRPRSCAPVRARGKFLQVPSLLAVLQWRVPA